MTIHHCWPVIQVQLEDGCSWTESPQYFCSSCRNRVLLLINSAQTTGETRGKQYHRPTAVVNRRIPQSVQPLTCLCHRLYWFQTSQTFDFLKGVLLFLFFCCFVLTLWLYVTVKPLTSETGCTYEHGNKVCVTLGMLKPTLCCKSHSRATSKITWKKAKVFLTSLLLLSNKNLGAAERMVKILQYR